MENETGPDQQEISEEQKEKQAMPQEIERKFLIPRLPENLEQYKNKKISQGYMVIAPDGTEIRLRQKGEKFYQTFKSGKGEKRQEVEISITQEQFDSLWSTTEGKRVEKTRYDIPYNGKKIELDIYEGEKLGGLISAEIEFDDSEEAANFNVPDWFGKNVTEDSQYKNQNLAVYGRPEEENIIDK